jgi:DNA-binding NarL/FixJ family response regulator
VINGFLDRPGKARSTPSWDQLTLREREVLKLIAEGNKNRGIAECLSVSIKTVEKHRSNLMRKLDLHGVSALTKYALDNGLISH